MRNYKSNEAEPEREPTPIYRKVLALALATGVLWYFEPSQDDEAAASFVGSKVTRAVLAALMTAFVGGQLYLGKTLGRHTIDSDEAPNSFGCVVVVEAIVALGLWLSLLA